MPATTEAVARSCVGGLVQQEFQAEEMVAALFEAGVLNQDLLDFARLAALAALGSKG